MNKNSTCNWTLIEATDSALLTKGLNREIRVYESHDYRTQLRAVYDAYITREVLSLEVIVDGLVVASCVWDDNDMTTTIPADLKDAVDFINEEVCWPLDFETV